MPLRSLAENLIKFPLKLNTTTIRKATAQKIDALYDQGERPPKNRTTESIGLNAGKKSIVLVDNAGKKTQAGSY